MSLPVRNTDPDTSRMAAARAVTRRLIVRDAIMRVFADNHGSWFTQDQILAMLHSRHLAFPEQWPPISPSGVRTRVSELVTDGLLEQVPGVYGRSEMGNRALLWRAVVPS